MSPLFRQRPSHEPNPEHTAQPPEPSITMPAEAPGNQYIAPVGTPEYFLEAPEVVGMDEFSRRYSSVTALMNSTTIENINRKLEEAPIERRLKRALINSGLAKDASLSAQALAQLLAEPGRYPKGDVQARYHLASEAFAPFRRQFPILNEEAVYRDIYQAAANHEPVLHKYWENSTSLTARLEEDLKTDQAARYMLANLAAAYGRRLDETFSGRNLSWLIKLLSSPDANGTSLLSGITAEISKGAFRDIQAYELLTKPELAKPAVIKFISLMSMAAEPDDPAMRRLAAAHTMWPKEMAELLDEYSDETAQSIRNARERGRSELASEFGLVSDGQSSDERFAGAMSKMIFNMRNLPRLAAHDGIPQFARKHVSGAGKAALTKQAQAPVRFAPTPEIKREVNNVLAYVDRLGRQFPENSAEYREMVDEFLAKYKGTKDLPEDLQNAIDYLRKLDMRKRGDRSGTKNMAPAEWDVEMEDRIVKRPLYEFKPTLGTDFPTKTQVIKDHRILFTLVDNDTVGIVGIVPRRDLAIFLKNAGINTGGR